MWNHIEYIMYSRILSPIFDAYVTHAHILRSNFQIAFFFSLPEYLYFKHMISFTCKQAPHVALVFFRSLASSSTFVAFNSRLRFKVLPNHSQKEVMRPLYLYYRRLGKNDVWGIVGGIFLELNPATRGWFSW